MMSEDEVAQAQFISMYDQFLMHLKSRAEEIEIVNERDPGSWTYDERLLIKGAVSGLLGMLYSGKL